MYPNILDKYCVVFKTTNKDISQPNLEVVCALPKIYKAAVVQHFFFHKWNDDYNFPTRALPWIHWEGELGGQQASRCLMSTECYFSYTHEAKWRLLQTYLYSDDQQFHQYQQNEQPPQSTERKSPWHVVFEIHILA